MDTLGRVSDLLVTKYGVGAEKISPESRLTDLGLDSLAIAELLFDLEDLFGIQIPVENAQFGSLAEAIAVIDRLNAAKGG